MGLLALLSEPDVWEQFYQHKTALDPSKRSERFLRGFIDEKRYLPVCERIANRERFALPRRSVISKLSSKKKRTVYTYPEPENTVLKLLTYLLLRKYDHVFSSGLYSFRPNRTAKDAISFLKKVPGIENKWSYKADISNYFNSVDIELLLSILKETVGEDEELFSFLASLLNETEVIDKGSVIEERKGIMAGTPLASFYADLFLNDLDKRFCGLGIPYARYSDDIILFADSKEQAREYADDITELVRMKHLDINPDKESFASPEEGFVFLGFYVKGKTVDIAPSSVVKVKQKMRRKTRALMRWQKRNDVPREKAALAFIRVFNRKLFENPSENELTWTYWFFPVITTDASLRVIDRYAQECIRTLACGTHTKSKYDLRYEDMKKLGYRSLVHAYYDHSEAETARRRGRSIKE